MCIYLCKESMALCGTIIDKKRCGNKITNIKLMNHSVKKCFYFSFFFCLPSGGKISSTEKR